MPTATAVAATPKTGDRLYIGPSDDCTGGLAVIASVKPAMFGTRSGYWVKFLNIPHRSFNLDELLKSQDDLKKQYGDQYAKSDFGK